MRNHFLYYGNGIFIFMLYGGLTEKRLEAYNRYIESGGIKRYMVISQNSGNAIQHSETLEFTCSNFFKDLVSSAQLRQLFDEHQEYMDSQEDIGEAVTQKLEEEVAKLQMTHLKLDGRSQFPNPRKKSMDPDDNAILLRYHRLRFGLK